MIAVQLATFFVLKEDSSSQGFDVVNLVVWLVGFIIYRLLMNVDIIVGNTLVDIMITMVICIIVNKIKTEKEELR